MSDKKTIKSEIDADVEAAETALALDEHQPKLGLWGAWAILTTFDTSGSIILIPWVFGQLGYVVGPILLITWVVVVVYFNFVLIDAADSATEADMTCRTLGEVGHYMAGKKGQRLFDFLPIGNAIFYLPVALETVAFALQYLFNYPFGDGGCLGWWNIISFGLLFSLVQACKTWHHISWLAFLTVCIAASKAFIFLPYAYVEYQDEIKASEDYLGPAQAAGNPENHWNDIAIALSTFAFGFGSQAFILFEVRHDMIEPDKCKNVLVISGACQTAFYLVAGLVCVALWGWNVESPITNQIPREGWVGILLNALIFIAVGTDYVIMGKIAVDWFHRRFMPTLSDAFLSRMLYTFPMCLLSLVLVLAIPNFITLTGVLDSIFPIGVSTWGVSLAWLMGTTRHKTNKCMIYGGLIIGLAFTMLSMAAPIYNIATTDYDTEDYFCNPN